MVWKKIFNVNTDKNYLKKLPYIPHIDKFRFLKIMIYLDKINEIKWSYTILWDKTQYFRKNRNNIWKNSEFSNVIEDKNLKFKSISGDVGDLVCLILIVHIRPEQVIQKRKEM